MLLTHTGVFVYVMTLGQYQHSLTKTIMFMTGHKYTVKFFFCLFVVFPQVAEVITAMMSGGDLNPQVYASCLLCAAELCSSLGPHLIPLLPTLVPCAMEYVGEVKER